MFIETLGEAFQAGWKVKARCAWGQRDGMKSIRECIARIDLDMETLVWTRGAFRWADWKAGSSAPGVDHAK